MIGDGSPREHPMVWVRRTKQVKELPVMCSTPRLPVQYNRHASGAKELAVACSTLRLLLIQYNRHPSAGRVECCATMARNNIGLWY